MLKEFKEFAMKGNVIDMAVGIIIGAAFGKIVTSLVSDVMTPPLGKLMGNVDFSNLLINPDISWGFVTRLRKRAWIQGARREGDAGIFDNMSRSPNKRNAVDMPDCADAVETL